jgi:hypothetical protein
LIFTLIEEIAAPAGIALIGIVLTTPGNSPLAFGKTGPSGTFRKLLFVNVTVVGARDEVIVKGTGASVKHLVTEVGLTVGLTGV